uniref:Uncharacterized protein n=1 Tax=Colletotrichum scovillei TaxID=1209932 RepID=A0A9P7RDX2_9PEZI
MASAAGYLLAPLPRVVAFRNNAFLPRSGQLLVSLAMRSLEKTLLLLPFYRRAQLNNHDQSSASAA